MLPTRVARLLAKFLTTLSLLFFVLAFCLLWFFDSTVVWPSYSEVLATMRATYQLEPEHIVSRK